MISLKGIENLLVQGGMLTNHGYYEESERPGVQDCRYQKVGSAFEQLLKDTKLIESS
jgi:hypothetical protein